MPTPRTPTPGKRRRVVFLTDPPIEVLLANDIAGRSREVITAVVPDRPVSDRMEAVDERLVVVRALQRLTVRQRAVLTLRYLDDLPEGQIAALLGCTVSTVRSQTHRALVRMRRLAPELGEPADRQEVHR